MPFLFSFYLCYIVRPCLLNQFHTHAIPYKSNILCVCVYVCLCVFVFFVWLLCVFVLFLCLCVLCDFCLCLCVSFLFVCVCVCVCVYVCVCVCVFVCVWSKIGTCKMDTTFLAVILKGTESGDLESDYSAAHKWHLGNRAWSYRTEFT
jgi:hypothetical protein